MHCLYFFISSWASEFCCSNSALFSFKTLTSCSSFLSCATIILSCFLAVSSSISNRKLLFETSSLTFLYENQQQSHRTRSTSTLDISLICSSADTLRSTKMSWRPLVINLFSFGKEERGSGIMESSSAGMDWAETKISQQSWTKPFLWCLIQDWSKSFGSSAGTFGSWVIRRLSSGC